jgi:hypothetical protein
VLISLLELGQIKILLQQAFALGINFLHALGNLMFFFVLFSLAKISRSFSGNGIFF